jgi:hypothetical protein
MAFMALQLDAHHFPQGTKGAALLDTQYVASFFQHEPRDTNLNSNWYVIFC